MALSEQHQNVTAQSLEDFNIMSKLVCLSSVIDTRIEIHIFINTLWKNILIQEQK